MKRTKIKTILEKEITGFLEQEEERLSKLRAAQLGAMPARLYMHRRGKKAYFTEYVKGKERGITKDTQRIFALLNQEQTDRYIEASAYDCALIRRTLAKFKDVDLTKIKTMADELGVEIRFYSQEQLRWMRAPYRKNQYKPENLKFTTGLGIQVRSKSELAIANRLEYYGIAYRYDEMFAYGGRALYPDFTIKRADGTLVLWEHFGLMNDEEYYMKAMEKIRIYRKAGFVQHSNLICTWEEDIAQTGDIDRILYGFIYR